MPRCEAVGQTHIHHAVLVLPRKAKSDDELQSSSLERAAEPWLGSSPRPVFEEHLLEEDCDALPRGSEHPRHSELESHNDILYPTVAKVWYYAKELKEKERLVNVIVGVGTWLQMRMDWCQLACR